MSLPAARQMVAGRGRAAAQTRDARQSRGPWEDPCDLQVVLGACRHSAVFRRILVHTDGPRAMSQYRWSTLALVASSPQTVTSSWVLSSCCGWESRPQVDSWEQGPAFPGVVSLPPAGGGPAFLGPAQVTCAQRKWAAGSQTGGAQSRQRARRSRPREATAPFPGQDSRRTLGHLSAHSGWG